MRKPSVEGLSAEAPSSRASDELDRLIRDAMAAPAVAAAADAPHQEPPAAHCPVLAYLRSGRRAPPADGLWTVVRGILDTLPQLMLLRDRGGRTLHVNRSARRWFATHSGWDEVEVAVRAACERLAALDPTRDGDLRGSGWAAQVSSHTMDGWYRIEVEGVGNPDGSAGAALALVLIEPPDEPSHGDLALRRRYRLTPAETRVMKLLAQGKTNRQIAADLRVSVHTVRHHVEHVFEKVGIHSRSAARETLAETDAC
jgi:DNA-binding CsgD family transcriptional regulator